MPIIISPPPVAAIHAIHNTASTDVSLWVVVLYIVLIIAVIGVCVYDVFGD